MNDEMEKMLTKHMPRVSKVNLAEYIRRIHEVDEIELSELLLEALKKVPDNKRVRYAKHRNVLTSVKVLLNQVPDNDKRKDEIVALYKRACEKL